MIQSQFKIVATKLTYTKNQITLLNSIYEHLYSIYEQIYKAAFVHFIKTLNSIFLLLLDAHTRHLTCTCQARDERFMTIHMKVALKWTNYHHNH